MVTSQNPVTLPLVFSCIYQFLILPYIHDCCCATIEERPKDMKNDSNSVEIPECNFEHGYCENVKGYPKEQLDYYLNKTVTPEVFEKIFDGNETSPAKDDNAKRQGRQLPAQLHYEHPLCRFREQHINPQAAKNEHGHTVYVVNHDQYQQSVRVELCIKENEQCQIPRGDPLGYTTHCRQLYVHRKLLAYRPNQKPQVEDFPLPSCCVCYIR